MQHIIFRAQKPIEAQGLPTDCLYRFHLSVEVNDHPASLGLTCGHYAEAPAVYFLKRYYRYISVATKISPAVRLAPTMNIGQDSSPTGDWTSASSRMAQLAIAMSYYDYGF